MEIALSQDQISKYADKILLYSNTCMRELRRLFLVQDLVDSLKVGLSFTTVAAGTRAHLIIIMIMIILIISRYGTVFSS